MVKITKFKESDFVLKIERNLVNLVQDNGETVTNLIFSGFDKDGNGWIDFNEFIIATHCTVSKAF